MYYPSKKMSHRGAERLLAKFEVEEKTNILIPDY